ncbi:hypothetical protein V5O48_001744 [Marasmius crinis-equi]|uniref:Ribosome biogenesis protein NSA1 n=1 Tax=Marasmius crinis-equi TaxID=585013 RepID=A0ABR3FY29_9AGAR
MRFFTGDELGNLKVLRSVEDDQKLKLEYAQALTPTATPRRVQKLAVKPADSGENATVSAAYADGTASTFSVQPDCTLEKTRSWNEPRLRTGEQYVGFSATRRGVFSCTSNGALRLVPDDESQSHFTASLPTRLCDWRLSPSGQKFVYGGDEVDLSVWDSEKVFTNTTPPEDGGPDSTSKKRKRSEALFPAESWRAKNVPNDNLGLRQPIRITSVSFIGSSDSHILAGTQLGDVRRYDTRAARKPVSNWKNTGKAGGVRVVESGYTEHQAFVGDGSSNLFAIDLRSGGVMYAYKGLSGAVSSIAPSKTVMLSTAQDRFVRLHSVFSPPPQVGQQQEVKGQVVDKMYMKSMPTVVAWDHDSTPPAAVSSSESDAEDGDVWEAMEEVEDEDKHLKRRKK